MYGLKLDAAVLRDRDPRSRNYADPLLSTSFVRVRSPGPLDEGRSRGASARGKGVEDHLTLFVHLGDLVDHDVLRVAMRRDVRQHRKEQLIGPFAADIRQNDQARVDFLGGYERSKIPRIFGHHDEVALDALPQDDVVGLTKATEVDCVNGVVLAVLAQPMRQGRR